MSAGRTGIWAALVVLVLLAGTWAVSGQVGKVSPRRLAAPLADLPTQLGDWRRRGRDGVMDQRTLEVLRPDDYLLRTYARDQAMPAALFVAFFAMQQEGQMIHSPRQCLPGNGWEILSRTQVEVRGPQGPVLVNHLTLGRELERLSVLYWFQGRGRVAYDEYRERLNLVVDGIWRDRNDGALVRLTSPVPGGDMAPVLTHQQELASLVMAALEDLLPPR